MPRRRYPDSDEHLDRWVISWADFLTLLFAFFVVMYAISSVNEEKYKSLSEVFSGLFTGAQKNQKAVLIPGGQGILEGGDTMTDSPAVLTNAPDPSETALLNTLKAKLASNFSNPNYSGLIEVSGNDLWLSIELRSKLLFESGSAIPSINADPVLQKIAEILKGYNNPIHVEGFTDNQPISTQQFPSNWELSAARSAAVVRLLASFGLEPQRMAAVGYGEYQPAYSNRTPNGRELNRRIVIVVARDEKVRRAVEAFGSQQVSEDAVNKILTESADPSEEIPTLEQVQTENGILFRQAQPPNTPQE